MPASQTPSEAKSTAWKTDAPEPPTTPDNEKTAEQWKHTIQAQKSFVAQLQQAIDKRKASIHYVEANLYSNGVQHNELQARKQADIETMEQRLAAEKKKLEAMQEACRQAGFGNAVYE
jgi:predicted RNase H-like nuclease (RuvC/YqgF family)